MKIGRAIFSATDNGGEMMGRVHWGTAGAVAVAALLTGCGGDGGGGPSGGSATLSGTVTNAITGTALAGATVSVGAVQATTNASGGYSLSGMPEGTVALRAVLAGFADYEASVTLSAGGNSANIGMTRREVITFPQYAVFAPAGTDTVRGVIVALGGPRTSGFVTGLPVGAPNPDAEAASQLLGQLLRTLARDSGLAMLGTTEQGLPDAAATDAALLQALATAASASGRPELTSVPVIMLGISGGGREAWGFTMRNASRVAGMILRTPAQWSAVATPEARQVPAMILLAQYDSVTGTTAQTQVFEANRALRAIWGLALEPNTVHYQQTEEVRTAMLGWIAAITGLRLPAPPGGAPRALSEEQGWLGNRATYEVAPFASYAGDPLTASWLPSGTVGADWQALVTP